MKEKIMHWLHEGHGLAHLCYFGAVAWEAHGMYGVMAGVLLILGIIQALFGTGGDL